MNAPTLRSALESLRRDNERPHIPLRADAERAIRRRLGMRWAARGGTALAVGGLALATAAGTWGGSGDDASSPSPSPTPQLDLAAATFPLEGGPEFAPISDAIRCGDPAPAPHPEQRELALSVMPDPPAQDDVSGDVDPHPTVTASLLHTTDDPDGVAATSGITFLVIRNGVVVGMQDTGIQLGWRLDDPISPMSQGWMDQGAFTCPETDYGADARGSELAEGTYQVMAVARVFSTPEAVALSQVFADVGPYGLDPLYREQDPQALYLPGSYDCLTIRQSYAGSGPRGCLPDFTERASVNADDGTVTVLYEADDLVGPFSVLLASEPIDVEIQDSGSNDYWEAYQAAMPARLESLDQLQCGATFESAYLGYDKKESVTALFALSSDEPLADRGIVSAGIWATGGARRNPGLDAARRACGGAALRQLRDRDHGRKPTRHGVDARGRSHSDIGHEGGHRPLRRPATGEPRLR